VIYYIACTATERLKIGYTSGEPEVRLKQLQTGSAANLRLIACHPGTQDDEKDLHAKFASQRVRGEWFEMSEDLFKHLSMVIWLSGAECHHMGQPAPDWVRTGLEAMQDYTGNPLPEHLAALL
jgi:hypothetical protein